MRKRRKYRKIKIIVYSLIGVGIIFGLGIKFIFKEKKVGQSLIKEEKVEVKFNKCYVAETNFRKYQKDITLEGLGKESIYAKAENFPDLKELGLGNLVELEDSDVYKFYTSNKSDKFIAVVPFENVDYRMKNLYVDGLNFWNKSDLGKYPLCVEKMIELEKQDKDKYIADNLFEYNGEYYTSDPAGINSMFIGGEIIPARAVDRTWLNQSNNYTLLFDRLKERIEGSDLALAMLENPISGDPKPCTGCTTFVGDEKNAAGFKTVGFDAFGVGNHFGDGGKKPLVRSMEVLKEQGIGVAGISDTSLEEASAPYIMNMGEYKVALLSAEDVAAYYWYGTDWGTNYYSVKSSSGGVGGVNHAKITKDIESAKKQADIVIVMMSWGVEYTNKSNGHQQEMAHAILDAGADMIVGSHPHWVQEIEIYKGKPIFYSLGNFIFDQTGEGPLVHPSRRNGETRQGMTGQLFFYKGKLMSVDLLPHKVCGMDQTGGESTNKTKNLAWKINDGSMTYAEVDKTPENQGCVWFQPTLSGTDNKFYKAVWDRMMQYTKI